MLQSQPSIENNPTLSPKTTTPLVSVCVITYNHKQYIAQALDSILVQKTNFDFEIVIGEDLSTDNTLAICKDYARRYPHIIRVLDTVQNLGVVPNFVRTANACRGKYMAVLEGDDYWIDESKLQKQADVLEHDAQISLCFTGRKEYYEDTNHFDTIKDERYTRFYVEDFAKETFFHLSTMLLRKPNTPQWFDRFKDFNGLYDRPLFISILADSKGYAYKLKDVSSVYRLNNSSTFTPLGAIKRTLMVADMYAKIKALHPELSKYMNYHLNKFDYFIMRDAYRNADKVKMHTLARQVLARPTIAAGWWLKCKAALHLLF
jgi:glycosyltransferase involved in cell wall biosynthesis